MIHALGPCTGGRAWKGKEASKPADHTHIHCQLLPATGSNPAQEALPYAYAYAYAYASCVGVHVHVHARHAYSLAHDFACDCQCDLTQLAHLTHLAHLLTEEKE